MRGACGHGVAVEARDLAVLEEHGELAALAFRARSFAPVEVIPAVGVKNVGEQRRAEDESYLLLAHARLQLRHHLLRDEIALLDVDAIRRDAGNLRHIPTAAQEHEANEERRATHPHIM